MAIPTVTCHFTKEKSVGGFAPLHTSLSTMGNVHRNKFQLEGKINKPPGSQEVGDEDQGRGCFHPQPSGEPSPSQVTPSTSLSW